MYMLHLAFRAENIDQKIHKTGTQSCISFQLQKGINKAQLTNITQTNTANNRHECRNHIINESFFPNIKDKQNIG